MCRVAPDTSLLNNGYATEVHLRTGETNADRLCKPRLLHQDGVQRTIGASAPQPGNLHRHACEMCIGDRIKTTLQHHFRSLVSGLGSGPSSTAGITSLPAYGKVLQQFAVFLAYLSHQCRCLLRSAAQALVHHRKAYGPTHLQLHVTAII